MDDDAVVIPLDVARRLAALRSLAEAWSRQSGVPLHAELLAGLDALDRARRVAEYGGGSPTVPRRPGPDWVSTMTAATALGITPRAVRKRIGAGTIRAARDRRGRWLIDPQELQP